MVAVVSGNGLGLFNTSFTQLGTSLWGQAGIGQSRESQYVNIATGNLILQDWDEAITVRGFDATALRTYNSQGTLASAGQDGFITGYERSLTLSGTLNDVNSTVTLQTGDGQSMVFKYSGTSNQYVTTDGDGANDTLVWSGTSTNPGKWTYTEGSSRREEVYATQADGTLAVTATAYLTRIRDLTSDGTTPAQYTIKYVNGRVSEVLSLDGAGAAGDALLYGYDGSGRLSWIKTREGNTERTQVSYGYDSYGRLQWIEHQLTTNLSTSGAGYDSATSSTFRTTYGYVTAAIDDWRIASVSTSDGLTVAYTYTGNKVTKIEQGSSSDGSLQTVTFAYNANSTDVTDAAGRTWTYQYDANKQLTAVLEPAISGQRTTTTYTYTIASDTGGAGNVKSIEVTRAGTVQSRSDFSYDASGNLLWQWQRTSGGSSTGTAVQKTYNAANQVQTETLYTGLDSDGPGASAPSGGLTTNFVYDAQNRLQFVVDATGAVRELAYDTSGNGIGQVGLERRYTGGTFTGTVSLTNLTNWATTAQKASSQLTEYRYDGKGRINSVAAYATLDTSGNGILDAYTDITWFTYDAHNLLLKKVSVRGTGRVLTNSGASAPGTSEVTDYVYDGMGRLLTVLQRDAATVVALATSPAPTPEQIKAWDAVTVLTQYAYLDGTNQLRITLDSGAVRTETRNKAGLLTSASEVGAVLGGTVTRTSYNFYDPTGRLRASEDAAGGRTYFFYDAMGRLSAQVDPVGAVTGFTYDDLGRVQQTTQYALNISTANWLSPGSPIQLATGTLVFAASSPTLSSTEVWVSTDAANDRTTTRTYDAVGRLLTETTASTAAAAQVTTYAYDGASRLLSVTINAVGGLAADARVTRNFYDDAGRLLATLDAAGYLTEHSYDAGGRRIKTTGYATLTSSTYWASGTLAELRPAAAIGDTVTRHFYDARGQLVADLAYVGGTVASGSGYLTEYVYDEVGNQRAVKAYAALIQNLTGTETLAALKGTAGTSHRLTQRSFNGLGQLWKELNPENALTVYSYDDAGRLVRTEWAQGTDEVRESNRRYDVFGNLVAELTGEQLVVALDAVNGMASFNPPVTALTDARLQTIHLDAAFNCGTRHSYDVLGRRIESTDVEGNKVWYFYDAQGRLTFTVRGIADSNNIKNVYGEVTRTRYSAFGQMIETTAFTTRISASGAMSRANVESAISNANLVYSASLDTRRQFSYDRRGLLTSSIDAENVTTNYIYTAFGQLLQEQRAVSTSASVTVQHTYDKRGLEISRTDAYGVAGLARTTGQVFDAFGRLTSATDGTGAVRTFAYDRLGRQVGRSQVVEGRTEAWGTTYDAFGRTVSQTDALGKVTTLTYDDALRTVTVTSPEAIVTVTTHNLQGQTVSVKNGANQTTKYTYNRDGQLLTVINPLGITVEDNRYDQRGLLYRTFNGTGDRVDFVYDAVGRVLKRIEDAGPGKLELTTAYVFDGQGRRVSVTDGAGRVTTFTFDREGRLTQQAVDPSGLNLRTSYTWDAAGRQLTVVEGVGATNTSAITTAYTYDALGRRLTEVQGSGSLNLTTTYAYDANDNLIAKQDAAGNWTRYGYDEAGRLRFTLSAAGNLTQTSYDANGRVFKVRQYAKLVNMTGVGSSLTLAQLQTLATNTGTQATDLVEYRVYNNDGQMRYRMDGAGNAVAFAYDGAGRNTIEKRYALPISAANLPAALASLEAGTATVASLGAVVPVTTGQDQMITRTFDAAGRMIKQTDVLNNITRFIYDNAGRTVATIDAMGGVTRRWFDAAGREIASRQFATAWTVATDDTTMTSLDQAMANSWTPSDRQTYTVLDATGRVRFTIDGGNGWTEFTYDGAGRRVSSREHADLIVIDSTLQAKLWAGTANGSMPGTVNNGADRTTYWVYNETNQVRYIIDAAGYAKAFGYDAAGRQALTRDYAGALNFDQVFNGTSVRTRLTAGTIGVNDMAASVVPAGNGYRTTYSSLDGVGRIRYLMTAIEGGQATVSEWRYDSAGRVTAQVQYATTIAFAFWLTPTQVAAALTTAGGDNPGNQRLTQQVYDGAGRLRFTIDDANGVSEKRYDGAGNLAGEYRYDVALAGVSVYSDANLAAWASGKTPARKITYLYDAIGQLSRTTDNLGNYELYGYDAAGRRTSYTNKLGATWNYSYDAAGRMLKEQSPSVRVYRFDAAGVPVWEDLRIATAYGYNAFGQVTSKTENADAVQLAERRAVSYEYDARGLLTKTTYPIAAVVDAGGNVVAGSGPAPYEQVWYDALGRASAQRDVLGGLSFKTYDSRGNLSYDVDARGFVTGFSYNGYGEQIGLTRYATASTGNWSSGQVLTTAQVAAAVTANPAADRSMVFGYDQRGNKTSVTLSAVAYYTTAWSPAGSSASPQTTFTFDSYGNVVKESVLLQPNVWADTYHYYDEMGRRTLSVDPAGFVTTFQFDVLGQLTSQTEYARAITTAGLTITTVPGLPVAGDQQTGYDRTVDFAYDALGRKVSESTLRHVRNADGVEGLRNVITSSEYDAADRMTAQVVDGVRTETAYDALGRNASVTEATRSVLVSNWAAQLLASSATTLGSGSLYLTASPYTETAYDAFGNAIKVTRFANGKQGGVATSDTVNDQVSVLRYDINGKLLVEQDPTGGKRYRSYNAAGHTTSVWYRLATGSGSTYRVVASYTYDMLGNQRTTQVTRQLEVSGVLQGSVLTDSSEQVRYNAFGEIIAKGTDLNLGLADAALPEQVVYDQAGRVVQSNSEGGAMRTYGYDLAGRQLLEIRPVYTTTAGTAQVRNVVDLLGRVTRQELPAHTAGTATGFVHKSYDRWGNVLEVVDARGYQTSYEYNELNQVVHETQPLVKVMSETGVETWIRPERFWFRDALGREVGSKDANGNIRRQTYDAAGQLVGVRDGTGALTTYAFDVFGRQRATQNALGYITYQGFDKLDRVTAVGDFLLDATGATRTQPMQPLQTYVLDIDGNRISVADALSHTQLYDFDSRRQLLRSQSAAGAVNTFAYDLRGNKIKETTGLWSSGSATAVDRDGDTVRFDEKTWKYDYFGRALDYNDLGQIDSNFVYDSASGQLTSSNQSNGASRTIAYYANGLVRQINLGDGSWYRYEYDANGNRTVEESTTTDGNNMAVHVIVKNYYDSHNRLEWVTSTDLNNSNVTQLDLRYDYDANGNRRTVTSQTGYAGTGNVSVPVASSNPQAIGTPPPVGIASGQAQQFRFVLAELFNDPDGTALTYSIQLEGGGAVPAWLSATTDTLRGQLVLDATSGSSVANGQLLRIKIVANDGQGHTASSTFSLMVGTDLAPVQVAAPNTAYKVRTGSSLNLSFNAYDFFADYNLGDELIMSVAGVSPAASWLTSAIVGQGVVQLGGTPSAGQTGTYQVTLKATDRMGASATMVVNVIVDAPVAPAVVSPLPARNIYSGRTFVEEVTLASLFSDANGDALTITAAMADGKQLPPWMSFIVDRSSGASVLRLDGFVPHDIASGTFSIRFTATDINGLSTYSTLNLTVMAEAVSSNPTFTSSLTLNFTAGQVNTYTLPAGLVTDQNGDYLRFYLMTGVKVWEETSPGDWISYWEYTPTTDITVDQQSRTLTMPIASMASGETWDNYYLFVTDSGGGGNKAKLTINVAAGSGTLPGGGGVPGNAAPVLNRPIASQGAVVNQAWAFLLPNDTFRDPEGQSFTLTAALSSGAALPSWLSFDAATGLFKGTPPAGAGSWTVRVTATDSAGATNAADFTITSGVGSSFATASGYGSVVHAVGVQRSSTTVSPSTSAIGQQYWYTYDGENRTVVNQGGFANGQITSAYTGPQNGFGPWYGGYINVYDAVGNVVAKIDGFGSNGSGRITRVLYNERGQQTVTFAPETLGYYNWSQGTTLPWTVATEKRTYDDAGRLIEIRNYFAPGALAINTSGTGSQTVQVAGWLQHRTTFLYNDDNQVTLQTEYGRIGSNWVNSIMVASGGNQATPLYNQSTNSGVLGTLSTTTNTLNLAGRTTAMVYAQSNVAEGKSQSGIPTSYTHSYTYTDLKRDSYLENTISGTSNPTSFKPSTSTSNYDEYGHRKTINEDSKATGVDPVRRYFSFGADGEILTRWDGKIKNGVFDQGYTTNEQKSNRHHYVFSGGQMVGQVDDIGRMEVVSQATAFDSGSTGTNTTIVQLGDTLESLSQRAYGTSSYWYVIASANGLAADVDVATLVGTSIKIPDVKTTRNDSSTFKPYNPAEIVGETTPGLVYVPPPKGCSAIATIIRVVIAVVVSVMLPPAGAVAGTGIFSSATLAAGGMAMFGEALAQTVEMSENLRDGYDIGGIVSAGVMAALPRTNWGMPAPLAAAAKSVVGSAINTGVNKLLGRETHFSWRSVATSAVTAALTSKIPAPGSPMYTTEGGFNFNWTQAAAEAGKSLARSAIAYGVQKAIMGEAHWNMRNVVGQMGLDVGAAALSVAMVTDRENRASEEMRARVWADQERNATEWIQKELDRAEAEPSQAFLDRVKAKFDDKAAAWQAKFDQRFADKMDADTKMKEAIIRQREAQEARALDIGRARVGAPETMASGPSIAEQLTAAYRSPNEFDDAAFLGLSNNQSLFESSVRLAVVTVKGDRSLVEDDAAKIDPSVETNDAYRKQGRVKRRGVPAQMHYVDPASDTRRLTRDPLSRKAIQESIKANRSTRAWDVSSLSAGYLGKPHSRTLLSPLISNSGEGWSYKIMQVRYEHEAVYAYGASFNPKDGEASVLGMVGGEAKLSYAEARVRGSLGDADIELYSDLSASGGMEAVFNPAGKQRRIALGVFGSAEASLIKARGAYEAPALNFLDVFEIRQRFEGDVRAYSASGTGRLGATTINNLTGIRFYYGLGASWGMGAAGAGETQISLTPSALDTLGTLWSSIYSQPSPSPSVRR